MATINNRSVRIRDNEGVEQIGVVSGWREGSDWVKVTNEKGQQFMVHCTDPMEYLYREDSGNAA